MFRTHQRKARLLFGLCDVLLICAGFEAAYQTRVWAPAEYLFFLTAPVKALLLGAGVGTWLFAGYWFGVYERLDPARPAVIVRDTFRQSVLVLICLVLLEFTLKLNLSRAFLGLFAAYSGVILCLFRWKAGRIVGVIRREFGIPRYVMIVGLGDKAEYIGRIIENSSAYGVVLTGFLADDHERGSESRAGIARRFPVYSPEELPELLKVKVIDEIIFAVDSKDLAEMEHLLAVCDEEGVRTHVAVDVFPWVNSSIYLDHIGSAPLLTFAPTPHDEVRLLLKRATDVTLALAALIALLPLMAAVALLVRLTSPGPVIFRQVRCGLNGRRFVCYKFRSMCADAESMRPALAHLSHRETAFKIIDDPRLTPVGRYLRKFSIDEWPQLWNVVKGEMSLVGPRPAVPEEVEQYERWQRRRLRMRPGLTCLWAINGRDHLDFETWMKLDMQYIDRWSLGLDWRIILRTIPYVLLGKGAH